MESSQTQHSGVLGPQLASHIQETMWAEHFPKSTPIDKPMVTGASDQPFHIHLHTSARKLTSTKGANTLRARRNTFLSFCIHPVADATDIEALKSTLVGTIRSFPGS